VTAKRNHDSNQKMLSTYLDGAGYLAGSCQVESTDVAIHAMLH
jgi:hypothetical protein